MRKEVLRLEAKVERLQKELLVATTSLEGSKKKHKVMSSRGSHGYAAPFL